MTTTTVETHATETAAAGLSYIALAANFTDSTLKLENLQFGKTDSADPQSLKRLFDISVPWCWSKDDFAKNKLVISAGNKKIFWVWENSNTFYYCDDNEFKSGKPVPGDGPDGTSSAITLHQNADGEYSISIVNTKPR